MKPTTEVAAPKHMWPARRLSEVLYNNVLPFANSTVTKTSTRALSVRFIPRQRPNPSDVENPDPSNLEDVDISDHEDANPRDVENPDPSDLEDLNSDPEDPDPSDPEDPDPNFNNLNPSNISQVHNIQHSAYVCQCSLCANLEI